MRSVRSASPSLASRYYHHPHRRHCNNNNKNGHHPSSSLMTTTTLLLPLQRPRNLVILLVGVCFFVVVGGWYNNSSGGGDSSSFQAAAFSNLGSLSSSTRSLQDNDDDSTKKDSHPTADDDPRKFAWPPSRPLLDEMILQQQQLSQQQQQQQQATRLRHNNNNNSTTTSSSSQTTTLIVTAVSCGFVDFLENWLQSVRRQHVDPTVQQFVVVVAQDEHVYRAMEQYWPGHTLWPRQQQEHEQQQQQEDPSTTTITNKTNNKGLIDYGSTGYTQVVNQRPELIATFLQLGFPVLYCDVDTVWQANIVQHIWSSLTAAQYYRPTKTTSTTTSSSTTTAADSAASSSFVQIEFAATSDLDPLQRDMYPRLQEHHVTAPDRLDPTQLRFCTCLLWFAGWTPGNQRLLQEWRHQLLVGKDDRNQKAFQRAFANIHSQVNWHVLSPRSFPPGFVAFDLPRIQHYNARREIDNLENHGTLLIHANYVIGGTRKRNLLQNAGLWEYQHRMANCRQDAAPTHNANNNKS